MLNSLFRILSLLLLSFSINAKDGYDIKIHFSDASDSMVYLCHYYGQGNSKVYRDDSTYLSSKGEAIFKSDKKITGGIYLIFFADKSGIMELILLNGDKFSCQVSKSSIYQSAVFKGQTENTDFYAYQRFLLEYGPKMQAIENKFIQAKNKKDSLEIQEKLKSEASKLTEYRNSYITNHPTTFLSKVFNAISEPEIPTELPTLPDGKKDSSYPRSYYKTHYWDKFDLTDNRLIYTPLYERKLNDYISKLIVPVPDSVNAACDFLLKATEGHEDLYRYTLIYLTHWAETSKIMGLDESFVYLTESYYLQGKAPWADSTLLEKMKDRVNKISPTIIGKKAEELIMLDTSNKRQVSLYDVKADYIVLLFWSPTCGHCQKEIPQFDSLYHAALKKYNVKIFAVDADNELDKWVKYINDHNLSEGWIHAHDPNRTSHFRSNYDVFSTPTIYLLDKDKIIRGKRIDHTNLLGLIEWLERKKKG